MYRELLSRSPQAEVFYLLGAACHGLGNTNDALGNLRHALRLQPDHFESHHQLGIVLAQQGKLEEALVHYRRTLELQPNHAWALTNLANVLVLQGQLEDACNCYRRVVALRPDWPQAHHRLALLLRDLGRMVDAEASFRHALRLKPDYFEVHSNFGSLLARLQRYDEAVACHRQAVALKPRAPEAHYNLALALARQEKWEEAVVVYRRVLELRPNYAEALSNLSAALMALRQFDEAETLCREFLSTHPVAHGVMQNLGAVLAAKNDFAGAKEAYLHALELEPSSLETLSNLAGLHLHQNQPQPAMEYCRKALAIDPHHAEAHLTYALALLAQGELQAAWPHYESRLAREKNLHEVSHVLWDGSPLAGRTIVIGCEQGFGDALQFIRYAALIKQQGGTVIVDCERPLARLLATAPGVDRVIPRGEQLPPFDVYVPLLSLPRFFDTSLSTIPAPHSYLTPDERMVEWWKRELSLEGGFKIGIAWQGNPKHPRDNERSIALRHFARLANVPGVRVFSLQLGTGSEQLAELGTEAPIVDLSERLGDFHNTGAIVRNLDLVIACDSSAAHLAGAIGVPVWLALAYSPDWRWMLERTDSPWYPAMRLFRQQTRGDWNGVFQQMADALAVMARERASAADPA